MCIASYRTTIRTQTNKSITVREPIQTEYLDLETTKSQNQLHTTNQPTHTHHDLHKNKAHTTHLSLPPEA